MDAYGYKDKVGRDFFIGLLPKYHSYNPNDVVMTDDMCCWDIEVGNNFYEVKMRTDMCKGELMILSTWAKDGYFIEKIKYDEFKRFHKSNILIKKIEIYRDGFNEILINPMFNTQQEIQTRPFRKNNESYEMVDKEVIMYYPNNKYYNEWTWGNIWYSYESRCNPNFDFNQINLNNKIMKESEMLNEMITNYLKADDLVSQMSCDSGNYSLMDFQETDAVRETLKIRLLNIIEKPYTIKENYINPYDEFQDDWDKLKELY